MDALRLDEAMTVVAPDGCTVRPMLALDRGSLAHCTLAPGKVSYAVRHRVVEEIWYFVSGRGEIWRRDNDGESPERESIEACGPGLCIAIPEGVAFQFRNTGEEPLVFLCMTMPPWPGEHVATIVQGKWEPLG